VIAAVAAAVGLATPSRPALVERWLHANRTHSAARLEPSRATASPRPPPDLRALAQRELGVAGRYRLAQPAPAPAVEPWWKRALDWISDRWNALWNAAFGRVHVTPRAANGIGEALLVLVGLLLILVVVRMLRNVHFAPFAARSKVEPIEAPLDPRALYRRACDAANAGEYGTAALLLFSATVALLDGRGAIAVSRSATVGDLRRELRSADATLVAPFDAVAAPFVERAYAERTVGAPQWDRARAAFVTLSGANADVSP
jgi:hypothetical protein